MFYVLSTISVEKLLWKSENKCRSCADVEPLHLSFHAIRIQVFWNAFYVTIETKFFWNPLTWNPKFSNIQEIMRLNVHHTTYNAHTRYYRESRFEMCHVSVFLKWNRKFLAFLTFDWKSLNCVVKIFNSFLNRDFCVVIE